MVLSIFAVPATAIAAQAEAMATISHNIANVNTPGSKAEVVRFRPLLAETQSSTSKQRGKYGLDSYLRQNIGQQGSPIITGRKLDLAISGNGFFTLRGNAGDITYTRNGSFQTLFDENAPLNANSFIGDDLGNYLLGWSVDEGFAFPNKSDATLDRILLSDNLSVNGSPSSNASVSLVLPINPGQAGAGQAGDSADRFSHGIKLIDAGISINEVTFNYTPSANERNAWQLRASSGNSLLGEAVLRFHADGRLQSITGLGTTEVEGHSLRLQGAGLGGGIDVRVNLAETRSYGGGGELLGYQENGVVGGLIENYFIDEHGLVQGVFSNGQQRALAQVAVADLVNPDSFVALEGTRYRAGENSGDVSYYDLLESRRASISSGQLESSTVDISEEFARLIETQNAYNLASLTLQTANELTSTALGVKR